MVRWFLLLFATLFVHADETPSYFSPKLYRSFWPDFCLEHLQQFPLECSEQHTDVNGNFHVLKQGASEAYIDEEILARLVSYSHHIPDNGYRCDFRFCRHCSMPVIRGILEDSWNRELEPDFRILEEDIEQIICYKCRCLKDWYDENNPPDEGNEEEFVDKYWEICRNGAIPHNYFEIRSRSSTRFLEQHLQYCQENPSCSCYWPYRCKEACKISDLVYTKTHEIVENYPLDDQDDSELPPSHDILTNLFINSFFYSQYRHVLLEFGLWKESHGLNITRSVATLDSIYKMLDELQPAFLHLYSTCLDKHPHPKIYYERGMIRFHQGETLDSLSDIRALIDYAQQNHHPDLLTSDLYFQEGTIYAELGLYDKAVASLTEAIQKDPGNKDAYFERAVSYFELGHFDLALEDYLACKIKPQPILPHQITFALGLTRGIIQGGIQSGIEFIPSVLSSIQGIAHGLWAFALDPVQVSSTLVETVQDCIHFVKNHTPTEIVTSLVPELRELIETWENLDNGIRGEITGSIIGKYGVDIFAGAGIAKSFKLYRELKKANNLLTLEAMSISQKNKSLITLEAAKRAQARKEVLQHANLKIQWDKQGKHIPTHANFQLKNKSILLHPNPQKLANDFCGKGIRSGNQLPGTAGYQEIVNFGEFIGYSVRFDTGEKIATTWGKIHYAKDGIHIVPTEPRW